MEKTACIFGSSGLTGSHLVNFLAKQENYSKIIVFNRRQIGDLNARVEEVIGDYGNLSNYSEKLKADEYYCCLGTTIKKAGSKKAFEVVDLNFPVEIAKLAIKNDVQKVFVVSSIGASAKSNNFYLRVKGMMEEEMKTILNNKLFIFRPSLLLGHRKENRFGESAGKILMKVLGLLLLGKLKKYKAIEAQTVAKAMVKVANGSFGQNIFESDKIQMLAN